MESGDDQSDARSLSRRKRERGSNDPDLEQTGPDTLPLLRDTLKLRASRDPCTSRKG